MDINEVNNYVVHDCEIFIMWWNSMISTYGQVTLADLKDYLDPDYKALFTDLCYGWTIPITTNNFIPRKTRYNFHYKLNLPNFINLKE